MFLFFSHQIYDPLVLINLWVWLQKLDHPLPNMLKCTVWLYNEYLSLFNTFWTIFLLSVAVPQKKKKKNPVRSGVQGINGSCASDLAYLIDSRCLESLL